MEKVYKSRPYRIILNVVYGILVAGLVGILVGYFSNKGSYAIIATVLIFLAYLWLVIIHNLIMITLSNTHLTIKKWNKEEVFALEQCEVVAKTVTRNGDTECVLFITDIEGKTHYIDCELIGIDQFEHLMEDLKSIGEDTQIQKLHLKNT